MAIANVAAPWTGAGERAPSKAATRFVNGLFWAILIFQLTALKYVWGLEGVARVVNLGMLAVLSVTATYALFFLRFDRVVWYLYIAPGLFVFLGMILNTTRNAFIDTSAMSYFGMTLPWAAYLVAPLLVKIGAIDSERLWKQFYFFMVAAVALGLLDYVMVFYGGTVLRSTLTPDGPFLIGRFSLLYGLEDGTAHTRFYACFSEPGTLAMYLLPAIAYALLRRRFVGLLVLLVGLALTASLGGLIGLMLLIAVLAFAKASNGRYVVIGSITALCLSVILWLSLGDYVTEAYRDRANSRTVRESSIRRMVVDLPDLLLSYPIGSGLVASAAEAEDSKSISWQSFNVGNALLLGGISSFLGYVTCLIVSLCCAGLALLRRGIGAHDRLVFITIPVLFTFMVQRTTVWDSALFAFLFAPSVIAFLSASPSTIAADNDSASAMGMA